MSVKGRALLAPSETIQRVMISTTSYFVGEFCVDDTLIAHAWPRSGDRRAEMAFFGEGPMSRCAFVVSFETPPVEKAPGAAIPQYAATADYYAAGMSVLFGKCFDAHGSLENTGSFNVPSLEAYALPCDPRQPHNNRSPRVDLGFPLNLQHVERLYAIFATEEDTTLHTAFHAAARFYARALRAAETDPESAYLHLITAGEIVSNAHLPVGDRLLDDQLEADVQHIAASLPDGGKIAGRLRKRLFEVKRRYVRTFVDLVDAEVFDRTEADDSIWCLKADAFPGHHRRGLRSSQPVRPFRRRLRAVDRTKPSPQRSANRTPRRTRSGDGENTRGGPDLRGSGTPDTIRDLEVRTGTSRNGPGNPVSDLNTVGSVEGQGQDPARRCAGHGSSKADLSEAIGRASSTGL